MKQLTCEMCGSTDLIKQDGVFVCQTCGCKYSVEEARKMMIEGTVEVTGTVKVDNSDAIENYLKMARNALDANNNEEAENYANKIIELDPQNSPAWDIKGEAAGWQSKANNNRMSESVSAWLNSIKFATDEESDELCRRIANKYVNLWEAMVSLHAVNFASIRSDENLNATTRDVDNGIILMNTLTVKGGVSFNRAKVYEVIAKNLNKSAVDGFKNAQKEFGPEHHNMSKWQWEHFTASCDNCVKLLEKAAELVRSDSLGTLICKNQVFIAETARDSSSWKYEVNARTPDRYIKEYSFTEAAKKTRTDKIDSYKKNQTLFEGGQASLTIKAVQGNRREEELELGRKQYWEEHQAEKEQMEDEKKQLSERVAAIDTEIQGMPVFKELKDATVKRNETDEQIVSLSEYQRSLGMFKGKEKKALQAQIDELKAKRADYVELMSKLEETAKSARKPLDDERTSAQRRISEIEAEFKKERGQISRAAGQFTIPNAVVDGKFAITPNILFEHLKSVLPAPYAVEELKPQACDLNEDMAGTLVMFVIDNSIADKNKNTGVNIFIDAAGKDEKIRSIYVRASAERASKYGKVFTIIGSIVVMSLSANISQSDAENAICNIKYSNSSSLYGDDGLIIEAATYSTKLLGIMNVRYQGALIRTGK
ncbi:hypothetical protein [Blautia intestinalis]|uniref:hypothetical protein n=1 Tax=Blautia intestinalis TaxID=2763028 RepID=UPI0022E8FC2C|nr:hypothetical protein [Blautia intestinalis]